MLQLKSKPSFIKGCVKMTFCLSEQSEHILWWTRSLEGYFLCKFLCEPWRQHHRQRHTQPNLIINCRSPFWSGVRPFESVTRMITCLLCLFILGPRCRYEAEVPKWNNHFIGSTKEQIQGTPKEEKHYATNRSRGHSSTELGKLRPGGHVWPDEPRNLACRVNNFSKSQIQRVFSLIC